MAKKIKIGFVNFAPLSYDVLTPYKEPLGGTESAMCYLTVELAKLGHKVVLFGRYSKNFSLKGVVHESQDRIGQGKWHDLDFMVIQSDPMAGVEVKPLLNEKTKLILWEHMEIDQPLIFPLRSSRVKNAYDAMVFVSTWQMARYIKYYWVDREKSTVIRNAVSPAFENLFSPKENILSHKSRPPILAYTATPFRGLEVLIRLFPEIRNFIPEVSLKVFSSFKVYQQEENDKSWKTLYQICRQTEGVEYIGSVGQERLAKELKKVLILAYPNTFPETSCITALEAMAAGCLVVSSELGAIPETTAGFAKLIPVTQPKEFYYQQFIETVVDVLKKPPENLQKKLSRQVAFIYNSYTWKNRAREWESWLENFSKTS